MMKYPIRLCIYLLLVVMPLQGIAAANLLICNSVMQASPADLIVAKTSYNATPCHAQSDKATDVSTTDSRHSPIPMCKSTCNAICASMSAFVTPQMQTAQAPHAKLQIATQLVQSFYASITLASLQRPPITLS
jgi:hypothetical protein